VFEKKNCQATSLLLGKNNYSYNKIIHKVRKHKVPILGLKKRNDEHKKA
jgi:hypothetical protein